MINTPEALSDLCSRMKASSSVALDTEFISGKRPETILSIVQVGLGAKEAYLIDVLAFDDLTPLRPILENQAIVKILHDASQDLGLIAKATKATPKNIFDVKLAARLLGMGTNYSLSELVQNLCGVHLSKGQQRSNWLRRPLKPAQIKYAERDVLYLHQIREVLLSEANRVQRTTWLEQEMCSFNDPELYLPPSPAERLLRSPATRKFAPQQCAVVAAIADWRTDAALTTGTLPKNLLRDKEILRLAKQRCTKPGHVRGTCPSLPRRYELEVANLIKEALDTPISACPTSLASRPLTGTEVAQLHLLLAIVAIRGSEYGIEPELIGTNAILTDFILNSRKPSNPLRQGWRQEVAGRDLMEILQGRLSVTLSDGVLKVHSHST
ncbi:MAG: hypothetical protein OXH34_03540 [Bacteroidetes bacterium]|nr:hypothetical protein [Bacteroidota bacterium]